MTDDADGSDGPAFPLTVRAAGAIWVGFGVLTLVGAAAVALLSADRVGAGVVPVRAAGFVVCCAGVPVGAGLLFLLGGAWTVTGRARDTLAGSVGSIALGVLTLVPAAAIAVSGVMAAVGAVGQPGNNLAVAGPAIAVSAAVYAGLGLALVVPGVLGLAGRRQYCVWREYHHPKKVRP